MSIVFLNEDYCEAGKSLISINDRGFLLGDGIFETLRIYSGKAIFLKHHWDRLRSGAAFLEIPLMLTYESLIEIIQELIERNNLHGEEASVRITLSRGPGPRGIDVTQDFKPTFLVTISPFAPKRNMAKSALIVSVRRNELSPSSKIKSLNYLDNILARREAEKAGFDEAILLNTKGAISEAATANLFFVKNDVLFTPGIEEGALPGITRELILNIAEEMCLETQVGSFPASELLSADEVFLTNSLLGISPLGRINHSILEARSPSIMLSLSESFQRKVLTSSPD